jgi:RNA polymerase sigma-70 factor (ECF subfamily)
VSTTHDILSEAATAKSLDDLFAAHIPQLYHAAARVLRHPQDSEDALQEGLLSAFIHLDQFQGRSQFSTWLHSIVVRAALMKLRHRRRDFVLASMDGEFEDGADKFENLLPDQTQNPEEQCADVERSSMLAEAIGKIPQRYRVVLQMCDIDGLMEKEAAQRLGTLVSVVKSRRYRGRRMLLRHLSCKSFPGRRVKAQARRPEERHSELQVREMALYNRVQACSD